MMRVSAGIYPRKLGIFSVELCIALYLAREKSRLGFTYTNTHVHIRVFLLTLGIKIPINFAVQIREYDMNHSYLLQHRTRILGIFTVELGSIRAESFIHGVLRYSAHSESRTRAIN